MTGKYGPQTEHVEQLIAAAAELTDEKSDALMVARPSAWTVEWDDAWTAALHAARAEGRNVALHVAFRAARAAALDAARAASWVGARAAARGAAGDTAWALVVRDLIGRHEFTQDHYDTLTGPWREAIGPVHPADDS